MDSPRGRIVLMQAGLEEGSEVSDAMVTHIDRCLGCMACVTACPSGVQYDKLIEATRPQIERNYERGLKDRVFRRLVFAVFTHPGRMRALVPLLAGQRRLGLERILDRALRRWPRARAAHKLAPRVSAGAVRARLDENTAAEGARRARVGMLQGCVQRVFFHGVNEATVRVLAAEGFEVFAPASIRCCGALMFHSGREPEALELAKKMIAAFEDCDYVAVNAAGCGSSMKDYGHVLVDDPEWGERAQAFSSKVRDVTELLAEFEPVATRHPLPRRIAYHDACHLAHAQGVRAQPRSLLKAIPGLEIEEPADWEICCGSAGVYNLLEPEAAADLGRRKVENLLDTHADGVAAANPGCSLQITAHLKETERSLPVYHPIELIDASIRERRLA
jgi:glycolate oxidase iron-sulfur subunit